ncbi:MAG: DUF6766 family protein, partial [Candidatus Acidiferrum sp.]
SGGDSGTESKKQKGKRGRGKQAKGKRSSWIYRNSLSLAFLLLFIGTFIAHLVFSMLAYNDTRALNGQGPLSIAAYARSATFWFRSLQTWEAEFGVIGVFIILSIFLRQEGSAESKPVEESDQATGETNK